mgnify:CR=1 FL=1
MFFCSEYPLIVAIRVWVPTVMRIEFGVKSENQTNFVVVVAIGSSHLSASRPLTFVSPQTSPLVSCVCVAAR